MELFKYIQLCFLGFLFLGSTVFAQEPGQILWASELIDFSSQYGENGFSASQAVGLPDASPNGHTRSAVAWSPEFEDGGEEFITLRFPEAMKGVRQVVLAQNFNPGSIYRIYFLSGTRKILAYENLKYKATNQYRLTHIYLEPTSYKVDGIKLIYRTDRIKGFNQLDAVAISDSRVPVKLEVKTAEFSYTGKREPLGPEVNSPWNEEHPLISADGRTLYFTRNSHPGNVGDRGDKDYDDIWLAEKHASKNQFRKVKNVGKPLNNFGHNYLNGITPDGRTALIAGNYDGKKIGDLLYISKKENNAWTKPEQIKIDDYYNLNPENAFHLSIDGKTILMSIAREDGMGFKDIHVSFLKEDGTWSSPKNIGNIINTPGEESTPFMAPDGKTLYFSTDSRYGYGGADIFTSTRLDQSWKNWSEPKNLGGQINSVESDLHFSLAASGSFAYFSSNNEITDSKDIFRIGINPGSQIEPVALVRGKVISADKKSGLSAAIQYRSLTSQNSGLASSGKGGDFQLVLTKGEHYQFYADAPGYYSETETVDLEFLTEFKEVEKEIRLIELVVGNTWTLKQVRFVEYVQSDSITISKEAYFELDRLADFLVKNPRVGIEIGAHKFSNCHSADCKSISTRQAKALQQYLVLKEIKSSRVRALGFGKRKPAEKGEPDNRIEIKITRL